MGNSQLADLRAADLRAVLEFTEHALTVRSVTDMPSLLAAVSGAVGADAATLTRIDLRTGHEVVLAWPAHRANRERLREYAAVGGTHPLRPPIAAQLKGGAGRGQAVRISDVLSRREWRGTPLFATSHQGVDDQMSTLLGGRAPIVQAVTLSRYHGAFTDRQAAVLAAGRGHLAHTLRRIQDEPTRVLQLAPEVTWVSSALSLARPAATPADTPTRRQQEILSLVATGLTDTQIGRRLGLSPTTVSKHLTRCYARLGVPNRAAAVRLLADPS